MVSTRSAVLLLAVSAAVVASTEAKSHKSMDEKPHLKHPVLKKSTVAHGKYTGVFVNGNKAHAKYAVEMPSVKNQHKKHHEKKHHAKQVSEKKDGNEHTKTFPHGKVTYVKNEAKEEAKPAHKKSHKKVVKAEETPEPTTEEPAEDPETEADEDAEEPKNEEGEVDSEESKDVEEKDFKLKVGEVVDIEVDGEKYTLEHFANGSTVIVYPNGTHQWVDQKDIYLDFEVVDEDEDEDEAVGSGKQESGSISGSQHQEAAVGQEEGIVGEIEKDVKSVAKKFSELATKLTGNGMKEAAPIIFIGGAIGALAAVVGIAAVAIGRARQNSADANPESVLADATEDVEADVEAGETEEKKEDEAADESQALDSSDSESESETEQEEGKFTNEVASV